MSFTLQSSDDNSVTTPDDRKENRSSALGRRLIKYVWNSGVIKPMSRDMASLTNQQFLTLYGTEDDTECLDKK